MHKVAIIRSRQTERGRHKEKLMGNFREQIAANESEEEVVIEEEVNTDNADDKSAEGAEEETLDDDGEPVVLEEWQKTEADDEIDGDKQKPEKSLKAKKKLKGLLTERETELTEQQQENERLRLENKRLKQGSLTNSEQGQQKRPIKSDFEDDDGDIDYVKYNEALDAYDDHRYEQRQATKNAEKDVKAISASISEGVKEHYTRAADLVEGSGINPDVYRAADTKFRKVFEDFSPEKGKAIADLFISNLGEGSEKVAYFVGNNEAAREKTNALLRKDPSGLKLMAYLGEEKQRLKTNSPAKKVSKAKAPATNIKSDAPPSGVAGKIQKQYDKAHKEGDAGKAIKIKRQAKKDKIDTSSW